jgi:hypothetical protein
VNRRAPFAWAALVGSLWLTMILCTHWEPVVRDGWRNLAWHRAYDLDLGEIWRLVRDGWLGSNPRLGQALTTVLYVPGPLHVIVTPLLELVLLWVMTAVVLGRWPSVRRADDALLFATVTAVFAMTTPQFGPMLFYRPYMGNYTFGLLLNLAWLLPYRFGGARRWWYVPLLVVLGVAAGMCNEHTGPAFLGLGAAAIVWAHRSGERVRAWMFAGLGGLAQQAGVLARIAERGIGENLLVVAMLVVYSAWSLPWLAIGLAAKRGKPDRWLVALAAAGLVATLVLLGSPKLGARLYVHSTALVSMAIAGWVAGGVQLAAPWARKACAALSVAVLLYVELRCVITYRAAGAISAQRLAILDAAPAGSAVTLPRYPVGAGTWFLGDDASLDYVAQTWGLASVTVTAP